VPQIPGLKVLFVAGFGPIVSDPAKSKQFYVDVLGLPLEPMAHDPTYYHGEKLEGVKHFSLWPLASAAEAVFGTSTWPSSVPTPNSWIEFDVEDVPSATEVLKKQGYKLLVEARQEPWGQTVTRLISPEGLLVGVTFTPWMRGK
jgi:catechol 2,3-dioxygenase-like lactoylglutathione lyase family enzyme